MRNWEAFVLDFDGVLTDSLEIKSEAFADLFKSYGPEVVARVMAHHRRHGGINRFEKIRIYFEQFLRKEITESEIMDLAEKFSEAVIDRVVAADEIRGATRFLERYEEQIPCFVNSATPRDELIRIVERRGWMRYFKEVTGAPRSKLDNLRYLLEKYHLSPGGCLFFGDAVTDYKAALACGVPFLGIVADERAPLLIDAPDISWVRDLKEADQWLEAD